MIMKKKFAYLVIDKHASTSHVRITFGDNPTAACRDEIYEDGTLERRANGALIITGAKVKYTYFSTHFEFGIFSEEALAKQRKDWIIPDSAITIVPPTKFLFWTWGDAGVRICSDTRFKSKNNKIRTIEISQPFILEDADS